MTPPNLATTPEAQLLLSDLQHLQFEWMSRLSRMNGIATLVIDGDLNIAFYDQSIIDILELNIEIDFTNHSVMEIIAVLADRGDFGPGDSKVFLDLIESDFSRGPSKGDDTSRKMNFLTPLGKRIQFQQDFELDGYFMLSCRDITEEYVEKHALRTALDSSNSGYLIFDIETGKMRSQNGSSKNAFSHIFTNSPSLIEFKSLIHPDDFNKMKKTWLVAQSKHKPWSGTFRIKNNNAETVWLKAQATPQLSDSGFVTGYIFFYTEVSAQLKIQDDLRKAIEHSERALQAKNAFLGRLSHEIRTPMNAVVGIADALIHHNGNPEISPKLELIQTSAEKIIHIVDESLEHTKLAEAKIQIDPQSSSPREAVENVCALWEQKAIKNEISLMCKIDDSVPDVMIFDSHRYEQCLNNLISNAVKFSPAGTIQVILTTLEKNGQNNLVAVVKDNGIGMNESQLSSLFEAYTQADKSISSRFGGTGLGMNITKQLIELMDGKITAKSTLGKGTVIALTLPIQADRREEDRRRDTSASLVDQMLESATPPTSEYHKLNILVVDDNATNHLVITSLLGSMVANIDVAENGIQAIKSIEKAAEQNAQYDVVLMDIHMPVMDGIEATLAIRGSQKSYTNIPIIALTADPQYQQKRLCKNIGMDDALAKPVRLTEVLGALDRVFEAKSVSTLAA